MLIHAYVTSREIFGRIFRAKSQFPLTESLACAKLPSDAKYFMKQSGRMPIINCFYGASGRKAPNRPMRRSATIYESVNAPGKWHVRLNEHDANGRTRWYGGKTLLLWASKSKAIAVARAWSANRLGAWS